MNPEPEQLKPEYERAFTVTEYYDGPRKGIASFLGVPHLYECLFDEEKDGFSDQFLLTPIDTETFQLAMEDWSIWQRWEVAFKTGKADMSTHPALPHEAMRHANLKPILDRTLLTNPEKAVTKTGRFEPLGEQTLPIGVLRALQVKWTKPLANLNGTLRTMSFPNENDE
jgi:hypothetical protein